jgi:hypothetical protein
MAIENRPNQQLVSDYLAKLGNNAGQYKPFKITGVTKGVDNYDADASGNDFLSWLGDIVSRPLFGVTELTNSVVDVFDPEKKNIDPFQKAINIVTAVPRGIFSTAKEDKAYTGDTLERITDVIGRNTDPSYVNKENNLDPVTKGIVGFAGDVLLDPLTWVPGGVFIKAGQAIKKGTQTATGAIKGAVAGAKATNAGVNAAKEVAPEVSKLVNESGTLQDGQVILKEGEPNPIGDATNGTFTEGPKNYSLTVFDGQAPKKGTLNQGRNAGQYTTEAEALDALAKIKAASNSVWDDALGQGAGQSAVKLPKNTATYKLEPILQAADEAPSLRTMIREAADPNLLKQGRSVIKQIMDGSDPAKLYTSSKPLPLSDFQDNLLLASADTGFKAFGVAGQKVASKFAEAINSIDDATYSSLVAIQNNLSVIRYGSAKGAGFRNVDEGTFQKLIKGTIKPKTDADAAALKMYRDLKAKQYLLPVVGKINKEFDNLTISRYEAYLNSFNSGKAVNILGQTVEDLNKMSAQETFKAIAAMDSTALNSIFGKEAMRLLKKSQTPESFAATMAAVKKIFVQSGALDDNLVKVGVMADSKINIQIETLKNLGVDYGSYKARLARSGSTLANLTEQELKANPSVTEISARMANEITDEAFEKAAMVAGIPGEDSVVMRRILDEIIPNALSKMLQSFNIKLQNDLYKATMTTSGIKKTKQGIGEGLGLDAKRLTTYKMNDIFTEVNKAVKELVDDMKSKGRPLSGEELANAKLKYTTAALRLTDEALRNYGIPIHMELGVQRVHVSLAEAIDIFVKAAHPADILSAEKNQVSKWGSVAKNALYLMFFNADTKVPPTKFMDAIATMMAGGTREEVAAVLKSTLTRAGKPGNFENSFATENMGRFMFQPSGVKWQKMRVDGSEIGAAKEAGTGNYIEWNSAKVLDQVLDVMFGAKDEFASLSATNLKRFQQQVDADVTVLSKSILNDLDAMSKDPSRIGELFKFLVQPGKATMEAGAAIGASDAAVAATSAKVEAAVGEFGHKAAVKAEAKGKALNDEVLNKTDNTERLKANEEAYATASEDYANVKATEELIDSADIPVYDTAAKSLDPKTLDINGNINAGWFHTLRGGLNRMFNPSYIMGPELRALYEGSINLVRTIISERVTDLRKVGKEFDRTELEQAFSQLQNMEVGFKPIDPRQRAAYDAMFRNMADFVDMEAKDLLSHPIFRTGVGLDLMNKTLKQFDVLGLGGASKYTEDLFDIDLAQRMVAAGKADNLLSAAASQWRTWKVKDPIDFIERLNEANVRMAGDVNVMASFVRDGKRMGFVSEKPLAGYVKLVNTKDGRLTSLLPSGIYVEAEAAKMFGRLEEVLTGGNRLPGSLGNFVHNYYDPILNSWKVGMTINRPGHHPRNFIGDESMTYVAEGPRNFLKSGSISWQILARRGTDPETKIDAVRALNSLGDIKPVTSGDIVSRGAYGDITNGQLDAEIFGRGLLPTANVIEDLLPAEGAANAIQRAGDFLSLKDTAYHRGLSKLSELRDHYSRIKHFSQIVLNEQEAAAKLIAKGKKPKFANQKELFDFAASRVKKFHPDPSMLTKGEQYLRRVFPFYTWLSKAIPALVAGSLTNPGRVSMFPKASYNLAIAMGVNPDSMYDPFPEDQMFPSFITEKALGPQWKIGNKYYGLNPGIATADIGATLSMGLPNSDPNYAVGAALSPFTSLLTPAFSIPLELMAGSQLDSGSRIKDYSDYIDSQIPGINYVSSISGVSPTGSILSLLQGKGLDPNYQTFQGNNDGWDKGTSAANWLFGLGITNYSRPNFQNLAELEQRNREAAKVSPRSAY